MPERIIVTSEWRDIGVVKGVRQIQQVITDVGDGVRQTTEVTKNYNKKLVKTGAITKTVKSTMGRFRAELLSVMFLGMAVSKAFSSLLKPAQQNVGIMELWTQLLGILFLPIMLAILPLFLKFMDFFLNLPEGTQMAIGVFVIFMDIIGRMLMLVGMLGLGWFGLVQLWTTAVVPLMTLLGTTFLPFLGIIALVIAAIVLLVLAFNTNFLGIRDLFIGIWGAIVDVFTGAWMIIKGIWDIIAGIFTGDWKRVWEGAKGIFFGIWKIIIALLIKLPVTILKFLLMIPVKIAKFGVKMIAFFLKTALWLWVNRNEWIPKVINAFKELGGKIITWAKGIGERMFEAIMEKIRGVKDFVSNIIGGFKRVAKGGSISTPSSQIGGIVPRDGTRFLHAGERVIPASQNINFNPSIIINVSRGMDEGGIVNRLKQELNEQFAVGLGDLARR